MGTPGLWYVSINGRLGFSQTHKIANIGTIAVLYLQHMMLVNMKINISGFNRIIFQGCRLHWFSSFLMAKLKRCWQYWHSCIVESL